MDLENEQIEELFIRAEKVWEKIKEQATISKREFNMELGHNETRMLDMFSQGMEPGEIADEMDKLLGKYSTHVLVETFLKLTSPEENNINADPDIVTYLEMARVGTKRYRLLLQNLLGIDDKEFTRLKIKLHEFMKRFDPANIETGQ